jgi:hypothetical protein
MRGAALALDGVPATVKENIARPGDDGVDHLDRRQGAAGVEAEEIGGGEVGGVLARG